jgi:hypothetical protein
VFQIIIGPAPREEAMENFISGGLDYLFPGECYQTMVEELNFLDGESSLYIEVYIEQEIKYAMTHLLHSHFTPGPCLKFLFSRLLSFVVIVGAVVGKYISSLQMFYPSKF